MALTFLKNCCTKADVIVPDLKIAWDNVWAFIQKLTYDEWNVIKDKFIPIAESFLLGQGQQVLNQAQTLSTHALVTILQAIPGFNNDLTFDQRLKELQALVPMSVKDALTATIKLEPAVIQAALDAYTSSLKAPVAAAVAAVLPPVPAATTSLLQAPHPATSAPTTAAPPPTPDSIIITTVTTGTKASPMKRS